jgi:hypothetical protein
LQRLGGRRRRNFSVINLIRLTVLIVVGTVRLVYANIFDGAIVDVVFGAIIYVVYVAIVHVFVLCIVVLCILFVWILRLLGREGLGNRG